MVIKNKKLVFLLASLVLLGGIVLWGTSAQAERVRSYTTQNINVNKAKPNTSTRAVQNSLGIEEIPENMAEPAAGDEQILFIPQEEQSDPETIVLERVDITGDGIVNEEVNPEDAVDPKEYILGAEDKIKVTVFGEKDLSGDYKIGADGVIAMPLIGTVMVGDKSLRQAEALIEEKLRDGYLKDPSVSIEVQESRPFYIMGEVRRPGSYNYINGMNVLQAVAISGGFTYRANRKSVDVIRGNASPSEPIEIKPEDVVRAGDIIFVRERFF